MQFAEIVMGSGVSPSDMEGGLSGALEWWPKRVEGAEFEDVPTHIASAASEAWQCHSIDAFRASCALARAVVEATAKDKGFTSGVLQSKIEALANDGHLRAHIKDAAHEIRHLGNDAAHGDFVEPVTAEESEEILVLMGEVLQEVYQSPARIARRRAAREAKTAEGTGS